MFIQNKSTTFQKGSLITYATHTSTARVHPIHENLPYPNHVLHKLNKQQNRDVGFWNGRPRSFVAQPGSGAWPAGPWPGAKDQAHAVAARPEAAVSDVPGAPNRAAHPSSVLWRSARSTRAPVGRVEVE
jgi:hypothetical protein